MKQMIIHNEHNLVQMALLEEGRVVEFAAEHTNDRGLLGSFFKGRIVNVLPGMQAAFVDIGQKKNAFLYVDDLLHPHLEKQPKVKPSISELVKPGQDIIVQVLKEPVGGKGARVTTHYSLPGRWLVYMPMADYVAVSKKIAREGDRSRLKALGEQLRNGEEGLIIRTVSAEKHQEAIQADLEVLRQQWLNILRKAEGMPSPKLLHRDIGLVQRIIRDVYTPGSDEVITDSQPNADAIAALLEEIGPGHRPKVQVYRGQDPIFAAYGVQEQLKLDFARKVWLPGGGYIVIDHTEALTVVDVNTGKYTGAGGDRLEDTVTETNMQAAVEIARLMRLRDIGGMIIVDFIDMEEEANRQEVAATLEAQLKKDRTKAFVIGWTKLGLLEMTRKKVREESTLPYVEACSSCHGTGKRYISPLH
ncbi:MULTISPECIES: Rne/Rng family ribonuclease [Paenibacillus]|uniref:Rne/Rng family ribonuclease n=1 Tax=Paenibacillus TaxID=44249 RepID=UPI001F31B1BC|nr:Rne/Rng family ribonuclease [Paenibacillus sp. JJ-223]CAH1201032.1 Ribonuclease G [Paenibacillus sp. JJ-223]